MGLSQTGSELRTSISTCPPLLSNVNVCLPYLFLLRSFAQDTPIHTPFCFVPYATERDYAWPFSRDWSRGQSQCHIILRHTDPSFLSSFFSLLSVLCCFSLVFWWGVTDYVFFGLEIKWSKGGQGWHFALRWLLRLWWLFIWCGYVRVVFSVHFSIFYRVSSVICVFVISIQAEKTEEEEEQKNNACNDLRNFPYPRYISWKNASLLQVRCGADWD